MKEGLWGWVIQTNGAGVYAEWKSWLSGSCLLHLMIKVKKLPCQIQPGPMLKRLDLLSKFLKFL